MQPWEAFQPDGVIMFSDILTPLPALGIEFDVVKGKGPVIASPVRRYLTFYSTVAFVRPCLATDADDTSRHMRHEDASCHRLCARVHMQSRCSAADAAAGRPRQQPAFHQGDPVDAAA